ncbi:ABC transporter ATP-binding protein [Gorillibacterium sp. CAU 1737]|uniref:ABC transporter ATP-binding protein n=1 Tax=Gorillibacterium sp. CAU 1737 TaxID=3140362 RepID=UPI003260F8C5
MLDVHRISYSFQPGTIPPVLSELSFSLQAGDFVSLIGPSGAGKSTLFKLIAGLLEPDAGELSLYEAGPVPAKERLRHIGYMPQKDLLLPWRTILANCLLPGELEANHASAYSPDRVLALLERFGLGTERDSYPEELSGGMRQRAAFLRTVATGRPLLLLDEPFGALDALTKQDMHRWLLSLWSELGVTVLFITHDLEEALLLSDRILILNGNEGGLSETEVPLARPRSPDDRFTPEFVKLREELERRLRP